MSENRPKLKLKGPAPTRDPRRPSVRNSVPRAPESIEARKARQERQRQEAAANPPPSPTDRTAPKRGPARGAPGPGGPGGPGAKPRPPGPGGARPPKPIPGSPAGPGTERRPRPDAGAAGTQRPQRKDRPGETRPPSARDGGPRSAPNPAAAAPGAPAGSTGRASHAPRLPEAAHTPPQRLAPEDAGIRLSKVMSDRGLASRREADEWIEAGWVTVDGVVASLGQRVRPEQHIEVDPRARTHQAQRVTILLHKPIGYVSGQAEDGYEPARVLVTPEHRWQEDPVRLDFNRSHLRSLVPAGRLDIDSTGLLVLTQDGRVARHLIGEDSLVEKEYLVRVEPVAEGSVHPDALRLLNHGLSLDDQPLKPARVSWANEDQLRFVLREGRKRQIRRMCELVGLKVTGLKRVRIGSVVLGKLPLGQWRYLGPHEKF